jgi:hypothetical protein
MRRLSNQPQIPPAALRGLAVAAFAALLSAGTVQAQGQKQPQALAAPQAVVDLKSAISQTAAVVEGAVTNIQYDYNEQDGPWTRVTLSEVRAHLGDSPSVVEIRYFGGPLPNGRMVVVSEMPTFEQGKRYMVFLRNTYWNLSPVVGDLALRAEKIGDAEVLVNADGMAVTGLGKDGVELGAALFEEPQLDGKPSKALVQNLSKLERKPLARQGFLKALTTAMADERLAVSGKVSAQPAGEFRWRAIPTSATPQLSLHNGAAASVPPNKQAPEADTSGPTQR